MQIGTPSISVTMIFTQIFLFPWFLYYFGCFAKSRFEYVFQANLNISLVFLVFLVLSEQYAFWTTSFGREGGVKVVSGGVKAGRVGA